MLMNGSIAIFEEIVIITALQLQAELCKVHKLTTFIVFIQTRTIVNV